MSLKTFKTAVQKFTVAGFDRDMNECQVNVPVFENSDGFFISGENENSFFFADYYDEFQRGWYIHPKLDELAKKHQVILEWVNPGLVGVYKA